MTTARAVVPEASGAPEAASEAPTLEAPAGAAPRRRPSRRRRSIEQVVIVLVFLVALGVTVALLAGQWLLSASVTGTLFVQTNNN